MIPISGVKHVWYADFWSPPIFTLHKPSPISLNFLVKGAILFLRVLYTWCIFHNRLYLSKAFPCVKVLWAALEISSQKAQLTTRLRSDIGYVSIKCQGLRDEYTKRRVVFPVFVKYIAIPLVEIWSCLVVFLSHTFLLYSYWFERH